MIKFYPCLVVCVLIIFLTKPLIATMCNATVHVINAILQQLLSATTNLQSSVNDINVTMNEMKSHQTDMQAKIDHILYMVYLGLHICLMADGFSSHS